MTVVPSLLFNILNSIKTTALTGTAVIAKVNATNIEEIRDCSKICIRPKVAKNGILNASNERIVPRFPAFLISSGCNSRPARNIKKKTARSTNTKKESSV